MTALTAPAPASSAGAVTVGGNALFAAHRNAQAVADQAYASTRGSGYDKALAYHLTYQRMVRNVPGQLRCPCSVCAAEFGA